MEQDEHLQPNISGVPEEVQKNILTDLSKSGTKAPVNREKHVGISVSENEDFAVFGYSQVHLKDITLEVARHLLINNCMLVYGGDLRKEGFTEKFADLAYQYRSIGDSKRKCFRNFFSFPIYKRLTLEQRLDFKKNHVDVVEIGPEADLHLKDEYIPATTTENRYIWSRCLSKMRFEMIGSTHARILIGGKTENYLGIMPGIIEEAKLSLQQGIPLYVVGAFGGAAKEVAAALNGERFAFADSAWHHSEEYEEFVAFYTDRHPKEQLTTDSLFRYFRNYSVEKLSAINGLTARENRRLFDTPHIPEILHLIFKGLNKTVTGH